MSLSAVKLGLVGTRTDVVGRITAEIQRQKRLCLAEVFSPCLRAGQETAKSIALVHSPSLDGLLKRTAGLIVAEIGWMGVEPMVRAAGLRRPVLILSSVFPHLTAGQLQRLQHFAELTGTLFMPELTCRWARSTVRVRELTAVQLRGIRQIELETTCEPGSLEELMIFDWCRNVIQSECLLVDADRKQNQTRIQFWRKQRDGEPVTAVIHRKPPSSDSSTSVFPLANCRLICQSGEIRITSENSLTWRLQDEEEQVESLQLDRTGEDLMYDLFGRRLVGGLVPVPDMRDVLLAQAMRVAREQSETEGRPVPPISSW